MINASLDWWGPAYSALKAMPSGLSVLLLAIGHESSRIESTSMSSREVS